MYLFNVLVIFVALLPKTHLHKLTAEISENFQSNCEDLIFHQLKNQHFYKAVLCGVNPPSDDPTKMIFVKTQLYHLMVVSGSHWVLLEQILTWALSRFSKVLPTDLLLGAAFLFFALATGFQPPIVRAFFAFLIAKFILNKDARLDGFLVNWLATLACLAVFPHWLNSFSLYLSACASLAVSAWPNSKGFKQKMLALMMTQILLLLTVLPWSWIGLLSNLLIAPILNILLIPLAVLVCIWHSFEIAFVIIFELLDQWSLFFQPSPDLNFSGSPPWLILLLCVLCRRYTLKFS